MLTRKQYRCLMSYFGKDRPDFCQTNYYFDTDELGMYADGTTCRIRFKNGIYKATVKKRDPMCRDLCIEEDLGEDICMDPHVFSSLGAHLQGMLTTERTILYRSMICEMVMDRNIYLGKADYELEVEYKEGYEEAAEQLLCHIAEVLLSAKVLPDKAAFLQVQGNAKASRFFERKKKKQAKQKRKSGERNAIHYR